MMDVDMELERSGEVLTHSLDAENTHKFLEWLHLQNGVQISPKVELVTEVGPGKGRGLVATDDIEEDEELFSIPYDAVICQANISWPVDNPNLRAEVESLEPFFGLVVSLMFEHAKGSASRWHRYFAILPTQFDTLMYWSESELKELEGSAVLKKINREAADRTFLEVLMPMVARNSTWFAEAGRWADTSNREYSQEKFIALAHRMANLIMGYAFDLEQKSDMDAGESKDLDMDEVVVLAQGMVPLADMLNADGENANARLYQEQGKALMMFAEKPIKTGDEILNYYGSLPSSDVLRKYGYVSDGYWDFDVVEIDSMEFARTAMVQLGIFDEEMLERIRKAQDNDIWDDNWDFSREESWSPEFLTFAMRLILDDGDFKHWTKNQKREHWSSSNRELSDPKFGMRFAKVLLATLEARLGEYPTSIEMDQELLGDANLPRRKKMAVKVRLGEKEIIVAEIDKLKAYLYLIDTIQKVLNEEKDNGLPLKRRRCAEIELESSPERSAKRRREGDSDPEKLPEENPSNGPEEDAGEAVDEVPEDDEEEEEEEEEDSISEPWTDSCNCSDCEDIAGPFGDRSGPWCQCLDDQVIVEHSSGILVCHNCGRKADWWEDTEREYAETNGEEWTPPPDLEERRLRPVTRSRRSSRRRERLYY